jgi:putative glutamine amidotransferase
MPRIVIPMPHSYDAEYSERAIPQYERAVTRAGGDPVRIALDQTPDEIRKIIAHCDAVLLPGSKADVDPARFHAARSPHTAAADPQRDAVDDLLLEDAYRLQKPVLGICYGLQSLNVFHGGSLVQHIPDFLPEATRAKVDHEAGKDIAVAHTVEIDPGSKLAEIAGGDLCGDSRPRLSGRAQLGVEPTPADNDEVLLDSSDLHGRAALQGRVQRQESNRAFAPDAQRPAPDAALIVPVNSSHHQSADTIGENLRIVGRCTEDGIIEALEGTAPDHFVIAVQWHPERSVDHAEPSRAIFRALVDAARKHRNE